MKTVLKEKNTSRECIIKWFLLFLWLSFIFYMSNQTGGTSGGMSDKIFSVITNIFPKLENNREICLFFIRKGAHIFEYFILGILIFEVAKEYEKNFKSLIIISLLCSLCIACFDEIHQLFIDGRAGKITDVMIDSIGYIVSISLLYLKNIKEQ
jgi:VanZ family protein